MASSGRATRSAPASSAALMAVRIRSTLPARSPTTVLIWAAATRRRAITRDYGRSVTWDTPGAMSTVLPVLKAPEVVEVIDRAAAPRQARLVLTRLLDAHPGLADRLASDRLFVSALVALSDASRSLSEAVIADVGLLAPLDDPDGLAAECPHEQYTTRAVEAVVEDAADPGRGLRRWKRQQLLRIAVRDLLSLADLPVVGRELASLAEGCLQAALGLARAATSGDVRIAVIGMGKLGGRELNYSSDV